MTSTLPPGNHNTFETAIDIGSLGVIPAGQWYFPSYYVPEMTLGKYSPTNYVYFRFSTNGDNENVRLWTFKENPASSSYITLYDKNRTYISDNASDDPVSPPISINNGKPVIRNGAYTTDTYYASVQSSLGTNETQAITSIGIFAYGPGTYSDSAGSTKAAAQNLGSIGSGSSVSITSELMTVYDRKAPTSGTTLDVDLSRYLRNDQKDFYKFVIASEGDVRISSSGSYGALVLHGDAQGPIASPLQMQVTGAPIHLKAGTYYLEFVDTATSVTLGANRVDIRLPKENYDLYAFSVSFSAGSALIGSDAPDRLIGEGGNDTMRGGGGNDLMAGQGGNDFMLGGDGNDVMDGGDGNDTIDGGANEDIIGGGLGDDTLGGGDGNDYVYGAQGNDFIHGGAGTDLIFGAQGNDVLFGGADSDVFYYRGGDGSDVIMDFTAGNTADVIDLIGTEYGSFAQVQANLTYYAAGNASVLTFSGGAQLLIAGVRPEQLDASDFWFNVI